MLEIDLILESLESRSRILNMWHPENLTSELLVLIDTDFQPLQQSMKEVMPLNSILGTLQGTPLLLCHHQKSPDGSRNSTAAAGIRGGF